LQPSVLFVVHAGKDVGLGHLTRSLVAAQSLVVRLGAQVDFVAVGDDVDDSIARNTKVHFSVTQGQIDVAIDRLTKNNQYAVICLDLFDPFVTEGLGVVLENLRVTGCKIVVIDFLAGVERLIDLLYVPSFIAPTLPEFIEFEGRLAYGWNAYLLNVLAEGQASDQLEAVLVLTGGGDVTRLGRTWPTILNEHLPRGSTICWVTGPFSERPIFPDSCRVDFIEHVAPNGLSPLMHRSAIAVTVYGVSFFELIAHRVPTVVFSPYGGKDTRELLEIARQRLALVASDAEDAAEKVAMLLKDFELRAELSSNARDKLKNFDGKYFAQEVELLLAEVSPGPTSDKLHRPALANKNKLTSSDQ